VVRETGCQGSNWKPRLVNDILDVGLVEESSVRHDHTGPHDSPGLGVDAEVFREVVERVAVARGAGGGKYYSVRCGGDGGRGVRKFDVVIASHHWEKLELLCPDLYSG